MFTSRRGMLFVSFFLFLVLLFGGCTQTTEGPPEDSPESKQLVIRYDITVELDPAFYTLFEDQARIHQIYNVLMRYKPGTTEFEPELAERWEASEDGKTYTFYLRKGVQWHKGYGEFTAQDVEFSFNRVLDPATGSPGRNNLEAIKNIEVVDDYTIKITFDSASPDVLHTITPARAGPGYIVSKAAVEELGDEHRVHPIGTGPYMLREWLRDDRLVLEANPDYFEGPPNIDEIVFLEIPEDSVVEMALQQGDVDVWLKVEDGDVFTRFQKQEGFKTYAPLVTSLRGIEFNTRKKPLDDVRVRRAIAHLIDNEAFVQNICGGLGTPAVSHLSTLFAEIPDTTPGLPQYPYDPEEAKKLFAEAGVTDLGTFVYQSGSIWDDLFAYIQDEARKIDVKLELERVDGTTWVDLRSKGELTCSLFGQGPNPTINILLMGWKHSVAFPPGVNFAYYDAIDDLIKEAQEELDPVKRSQAYQNIQIKMMEDLPAIPIYHHTFGEITNDKVLNWYPRSTGSDYPLRLVDLASE